MNNDEKKYNKKTAFLINANARKVNKTLANKLIKIIPNGDLYYSKRISQSSNFLKKIIKMGYGSIFSGGGDGTIVNTINILNNIKNKSINKKIPKLGILKLGTGNAIAHILGSSTAFSDITHILNGGSCSDFYMNMVKCGDNKLAPFAGIGYDAQILNNYLEIKKKHKGYISKNIINSLFGYIYVILKNILSSNYNEKNKITIYSNEDAYKIVRFKEKINLISIPKGSLIFKGYATAICVGAISCYGYGLKIFPFANYKEGFIQLRISQCKIRTLLANIYPKLWKGTFKHPDLHDFLVKNINIKCDQPMPYQIAGDLCGKIMEINFKISDNPISMLKLPKKRF